MNASVLFLSFAPLIAYVILDLFFGLKWGVIGAIILALAECVANYVFFHDIDYVAIGSAILIGVLGLITLKTNNPRIFKFQPVILGVTLATVLAYFQLFAKPLFLYYIDRDSVLIAPEMRAAMSQPDIVHKMTIMFGHIIIGMYLHAAVVAYAALKLSTKAWILLRTVGFYAMMFGIMMVDAVLLQR